MLGKILYLDVETTGLDATKHAVWQVAVIIEINGEVKERWNGFINPFSSKPDTELDDYAMKMNKLTREKLESYPNSKDVLVDFSKMLYKYKDKTDKYDKFTICGYNSNFDMKFIEAWYLANGANHLFSQVHYKDVDVFALVKVLQHLGKIDTGWSQALPVVAKHFNLEHDAHDAMSDIEVTKELLELLEREYLK
jgi:DNA polymerase III subunit epsilon